MTDNALLVHSASAPGQSAATPSRLWFVDNLRIALISLVVLHHIACIYSGIPAWYYTERPSSAAVGMALSVFLLMNQAWFMGAFFLISGYFTPGSYDRKGAAAFLRDRLTRLGIPLLVFYFVLNPILYLGAYHGGSPLHAYPGTIGSGPLWFVLVLLVLDGCYAAIRLTAAHRPRGRDRGAPNHLMLAGFVLLLALATYVLRIVIPAGFVVPVLDLPTGDYLPQYVSFFVLGTVAYRRNWFHTISARMGVVGLGMAIGATVTFLPLALLGGLDGWVGHGTASSLFYALWDSTFAIGVVLALLVFFRSRFNSSGSLNRRLSSQVFTVYVSHAFIVTGAGYLLGMLDLPTLAKFAIAVVVVLPACFLVAGPIRRIPGLRRVL